MNSLGEVVISGMIRISYPCDIKKGGNQEFASAAIELFALLSCFLDSEQLARTVLNNAMIKDGKVYISFPRQVKNRFLLKNRYIIPLRRGAPHKFFCEIIPNKSVNDFKTVFSGNINHNLRSEIDKYLRNYLIKRKKKDIEFSRLSINSVRLVEVFLRDYGYGFKIEFINGRESSVNGIDSVDGLKKKMIDKIG